MTARRTPARAASSRTANVAWVLIAEHLVRLGQVRGGDHGQVYDRLHIEECFDDDARLAGVAMTVRSVPRLSDVDRTRPVVATPISVRWRPAIVRGGRPPP